MYAIGGGGFRLAGNEVGAVGGVAGFEVDVDEEGGGGEGVRMEFCDGRGEFLTLGGFERVGVVDFVERHGCCWERLDWNGCGVRSSLVYAEPALRTV